jgi:nitrogen fixation protein FixH
MAGARQPGWWYPWIFIAVMVAVIAVNAVMATLAIRTFPGLQTEDAYNKGLHYNETIAAGREQARRGWRMDLEIRPLGGARGSGREAEVVVAFSDRDGQPLDRLEVEATLIRPATAAFDRTVSLEGRGGGVYAAAVTLPLSGQWDARVTARRETESFEARRRLVLP